MKKKKYLIKNNANNFFKKPKWLKKNFLSLNRKFYKTKSILRLNKLKTVCEEALCPNIIECFKKKTVTFIIMGNICTRNCGFCSIKHGKPNVLNFDEPKNIAKAVFKLNLNYVVITSVNRDDLIDGGAKKFVECIKNIRKISPNTIIEILIPDFKKKSNLAINIFNKKLPNIINHNIETIPRIYNKIKPGSNYLHSLKLLKNFKLKYPNILTKSGLMVGLGETDDEILKVMIDIKKSKVDILTIGQYLMPSKNHILVHRYVKNLIFKKYEKEAYKMGFLSVFSGPMVRSSYNALEKFKNF